MKFIETYHTDLLNGTGLREVLFLSGCEHHCPGCFNKFTWDPDNEQAKEFTEIDYTELLNNLKKPYCSGLTLSGGDPLSIWNVHDVKKLLERLRHDIPHLNIWVYTGYTIEQINGLFVLNGYGPINGEYYHDKDEPDYVIESTVCRKSILKLIDVLVDGRFIESRKSPNKPWVGSDNQRVIDVPKSLKSGTVVLYEQ